MEKSMKKILLLVCLVVGIGFALDSREGDSLALVAIMVENPGSSLSWDVNVSIDDWSGVTVWDGRVFELDIEGKSISILPSKIGNLTSLRELYLGFNSLTSLPTEIGSLTSLVELDLNNNSLATLPDEIKTLTNLTYLDASTNQLQEKNLTPDIVTWLDTYDSDWRDTQDISAITKNSIQLTPKKLHLTTSNQTLNFSTPLPTGTNLSIFTVNGKEIMRKAISGSSLNLPSLSKGVYLVKVLGENLNSVFKISVK